MTSVCKEADSGASFVPAMGENPSGSGARLLCVLISYAYGGRSIS
jgi:hypothetical protein